MESVINQYQKTVRPSYWEFIAPSREFADIMVNNGGKSWAAIDLVKQKIKQRVEKYEQK